MVDFTDFPTVLDSFSTADERKEMVESHQCLTVLSYGGGQDSTALLYKYVYDPSFRAKYAPDDFLVIMADTADEHKHTYEHLAHVRDFCKAHGIKLIILPPTIDNVSKAWVGGLSAHFRRYKIIISKAMRSKSCTDQLKINPIYRYLDKYVNETYLFNMFAPSGKKAIKAYASRFGKIKVLIGISAEEASRRIEQKSDKSQEEKSKWMSLSVQKVYPLVDLGMTRSDCQKYIDSVGQPVPFPSNCKKCPYLSPIELVWLHRFDPATLEEWIGDEQAKVLKFKEVQAARGKANHGVMGSKTLPETLVLALNKYGHMTDDELNEYKFSHGHCVQSKY